MDRSEWGIVKVIEKIVIFHRIKCYRLIMYKIKILSVVPTKPWYTLGLTVLRQDFFELFIV